MAFIVTGGTWQDQGYYETYSNPQFDAGARTIEELTADGSFTFTVGQATGIVCGLNAVDLDADYLEIEHAFYIENGKVRVVENGVFKTVFSNYTTGAVFKIERIGGVVKYYVDSILKYTSLSASIGTVFLDCSLYAANDTIILGEVTVLNPSETLTISLPKPAIGFIENDDTANIIIELSPPVLYLEELLAYELNITLPKPELEFLVEGESRLIIDLPKPTIYIRETLIVPDYSVLQFSLPKPQLRLNEEENLSLDIELPLAVVISEVPDFCHITLPKPIIGFQEELQNFFLIGWPKWKLVASDNIEYLININNSDYGTTAIALHRVNYDGVNEIIAFNEVYYGITAQSLFEVIYQSKSTIIAQTLNEVGWESAGTSSVVSLHDAGWSSLIRSTAQTLHDSIYATIGSETIIALHEAGWASAGGVTAVLSIHESGWSSLIRTPAQSLNEVSWASTGFTSIVQLHESSWESAGTYSLVFAVNDSSWMSVGNSSTAISLHEVSWSSGIRISAMTMNEVLWSSVGTTPTLMLHDASWYYTPLALQANQSSWKSIISARSIHTSVYETADNSLAIAVNSCRYRSNQVAPIITAGIIYARI